MADEEEEKEVEEDEKKKKNSSGSGQRKESRPVTHMNRQAGWPDRRVVEREQRLAVGERL